MKKMPYALIFILLLAILVFAGCKSFFGSPEETTELTQTSETETTTEIAPETSTEEESTEEETTATEETAEDTTAEPVVLETTTEAPALPETTTETPASEGTTEETTTAAPVQEVTNQYDVLRSGRFYLKGSMYDGHESNPLTLAVGDTLVYMETSMDNAAMGFLISNKKTYLLNPMNKTYTEFGSVLSSILQNAGMMSQEEILNSIDEMGFAEMKPLSDANEIQDSAINGVPCKVYIFIREEGGTTRVYMDGERLLGFEKIREDGVYETGTYIDEISAVIPTLPPSDYTKQNIYSFITTMEGILD